MRVSIAFTGFGSLESTLPAVEAAERCRLDGVWSAEHIGFHDAVVPSAVYLRATKRLEVGLVGLSTAARHPGTIAMELLSLSEIGGGRVRVAIGTGDPSLVGKLGKTVTKPLGANAAFIGSLREAMRGSDMTIEHSEFAFKSFRAIPFGPPVPIDLMAIRPKMIRLAATDADGISISMGASRPYIRETVATIGRELAAAGRKRESFRVTAIAMGIIAEDLETALGPVKAMLSMFPQETAEVLAKGIVEPGSLVEAAKRGPMAVMKAWSSEAIAGTMLACAPGGLRKALAAYADTGIDELALVLAADPDVQPKIVEQLAAARP